MLSDARGVPLVAGVSAANTHDIHALKPLLTFWSVDEARRFLESAREYGDSLYGMWALVLVLGLRKSEALGARWENVDLDAGTLDITVQLQRVRGTLFH